MDAIDYQRSEWAKYEQLSIDKVKAGGSQITYIGDKTEWQKLMDPLYKKQSKEIQDFVKQIQAVK